MLPRRMRLSGAWVAESVAGGPPGGGAGGGATEAICGSVAADADGVGRGGVGGGGVGTALWGAARGDGVAAYCDGGAVSEIGCPAAAIGAGPAAAPGSPGLIG